MTDLFNAKCQISPRAAASRVGEEMVLLHLETGTYFGLDELGTMIWGGLQEGQSPREICQRIAASYGEPPERIEEDVHAFLAKLSENGLLDYA